MAKINWMLGAFAAVLLVVGLVNIVASARSGMNGPTEVIDADGQVMMLVDKDGQPKKVVTSPGLSWLDWTIVALYSSGTVVFGWMVSRRRRSREAYFLGNGKMNPTIVGISLFATLVSTISYLSMPGEAMGKGPARFATIFGWPVIYLTLAYVILPIYMRRRVTSAYELLEERLGVGIRLLGAVMFIALRLVWMSLLIYLASMTMAHMMGIGQHWVPLVVLCVGIVAVLYTALGGLEAVVVTDLIQSVLLLSGALLVIGMVTWDFGGFGWFPTRWEDNWDSQPFFSTDLSTRITVLGSLLSMAVWYICTAASDQTCVQRFMATENLAAARRAYKAQMFTDLLVGTTLAGVGFALLAYFKAHPVAGLNMKTEADLFFPYFIANILPPGLSGLVIAAMFAAAMSSLDSGVNSITAVVSRDFLERFGRQVPPATNILLALAIGALVVVTSSVMEYVPGNITEKTERSVNLLVTPIFCLFFFAMFVPFANARGVLVGCVTGIGVAVLVGFGGNLFGFVANPPIIKDLSQLSVPEAFDNRHQTRVTIPARESIQAGDRLLLQRDQQTVAILFVGDDESEKDSNDAAEASAVALDNDGLVMAARVAKVLQEQTVPHFNAEVLAPERPGGAPQVKLAVELAPVSQQWIGVFSLLANLAVGLIACKLFDARRKPSGLRTAPQSEK